MDRLQQDGPRKYATYKGSSTRRVRPARAGQAAAGSREGQGVTSTSGQRRLHNFGAGESALRSLMQSPSHLASHHPSSWALYFAVLTEADHHFTLPHCPTPTCLTPLLLPFLLLSLQGGASPAVATLGRIGTRGAMPRSFPINIKSPEACAYTWTSPDSGCNNVFIGKLTTEPSFAIKTNIGGFAYSSLYQDALAFNKYAEVTCVIDPESAKIEPCPAIREREEDE